MLQKRDKFGGLALFDLSTVQEAAETRAITTCRP